MNISATTCFCSDTLSEITDYAAALIIARAYCAVNDHERFSMVLAGGRSPQMLYEKLAGGISREVLEYYKLPLPKDQTITSRYFLPAEETWLFMGDERCVPPDHPDSNYRMIREKLLSISGIPEDHLFRMEAEAADTEQAASNYEESIRAFVSTDPRMRSEHFPLFDLVLLGLGEDGHTASLFSGNRALLPEQTRWVLPVYAPAGKPPGMRLTLTLPVINHARTILFFAPGEEKYMLAEKIACGKMTDVPASLVKPEKGKLFWFITQPPPRH